MHHVSTRLLLLLLVVLCILGAALWSVSKHFEIAAINSYDACAKAGYPILDSYPSQCRTPDGRSFVNPDEQFTIPTATDTSSAAGCVVGGCSGEVCSDASDGPAMSNCIYRAEFACYKSAQCERQVDGTCGWTQTSELSQCLTAKAVSDSTELPQ
jgi:eight-cysteine-cluster-containing protein